jgi:hypothetical protein
MFDDTVKVQSYKGFNIIEAQVPGTRRTCRFVLTTAFPVCFSKQLAKEIRYKPGGFVLASFAGQPEETYAAGLLESITLSHTEFEFINAIIASDTIETFLQALQADGIIGSNLFNAACWQLNIREGYLRFSGKTGHFGHLKNAVKVAMPKTKGIFQAIWNTEMNGKKVKIIPDLLYSGWIRLAKNFPSEALLSPVFVKYPSITTLFCYQDTLSATSGTLKIKDWPDIKYIALLDTSTEHSLLGRWIFEQCIVTLDYINYQAYITFPEALKQPLWMGGYNGNGIVVSFILSNASGIQQGDIITDSSDSLETGLFYRIPREVMRQGNPIRIED